MKLAILPIVAVFLHKIYTEQLTGIVKSTRQRLPAIEVGTQIPPRLECFRAELDDCANDPF